MFVQLRPYLGDGAFYLLIIFLEVRYNNGNGLQQNFELARN